MRIDDCTSALDGIQSILATQAETETFSERPGEMPAMILWWVMPPYVPEAESRRGVF